MPKVPHLHWPRHLLRGIRCARLSSVLPRASALMCDHTGLMMLMSERSTHLEQTLFPLIAGVGLGMLFHAPYQVFTRALRRQEVASGTSAFFLVRFTGATVGLVSVLLLRTFRACNSDRTPPLPGRRGRRIPRPAVEHAAAWGGRFSRSRIGDRATGPEQLGRSPARAVAFDQGASTLQPGRRPGIPLARH